MGVLDINTNIEPAPEVQASRRIIADTQRLFLMMVRNFNEGAKNFWQNSEATPEQIADALGANAAEVFYLHARLGELIALVKPEAIAEGLSVVGEFIMNEDGTVTVTSVPTPEPEPTLEPLPDVMP